MKSVIFMLIMTLSMFITGCSTKSSSINVVDGDLVEVISDHNDDFENRVEGDDDDSVRVVDIISLKFKELYEWE